MDPEPAPVPNVSVAPGTQGSSEIAAKPSGPVVQPPPPVVEANDAPVVATPLTPSTKPAYPDPSSLADALRTVNEKYAKQIQTANDPQKKGDLARMFLMMASAAGIEPAQKVAMLQMARDLAINAGDAKNACEAIQGLQEYPVDILSLKFNALDAISRSVNSAGADGLAKCLRAAIQDALAVDRYEIAKRLANMQVAAVQRAGEEKAVESALTQLREIEKTEGYFLQSRAAIDALANGGKDPRDNLAAGRFYCFVKGDWEKGIPMLAKGSDPALKLPAEQEQGHVSDPGKKVELADCWWDAGEREPRAAVKTVIRQHASEWYVKALPALAGAERTRVDQRISEAAKSNQDIAAVPDQKTGKFIVPAVPVTPPHPPDDFDVSLCVELRINRDSKSSINDFKKLEVGGSVVVEGTVTTINFAGSKLDISLNFCRIIEYSLSGQSLKPAGLTTPSPKELYDTFKAELAKNPGGKALNEFLKKQYANLKGKRVTWQIPVNSKGDKTEEIASLQSDLKDLGKSLAEYKKPRYRTVFQPESREGQFIRPAHNVEVPEEKSAWEKEQIQSLETKMQSVNKLVSEKKISQWVVNPIDGDTGNGAIVPAPPKHNSTDPGRESVGDDGSK